MIEIKLLLTNEENITWYQVLFLKYGNIDGKISDKYSSLGYYYMLYQHHMWKTDYNIQHQESPPSNVFFVHNYRNH